MAMSEMRASVLFKPTISLIRSIVRLIPEPYDGAKEIRPISFERPMKRARPAWLAGHPRCPH